jgi:hypothetical protein
MEISEFRRCHSLLALERAVDDGIAKLELSQATLAGETERRRQ